MENTDDELTNDKTEEQEDDYQLIDPNDLIIIDDPDNWKPPEEIILAYATLLGYDPAKEAKSSWLYFCPFGPTSNRRQR